MELYQLGIVDDIEVMKKSQVIDREGVIQRKSLLAQTMKHNKELQEECPDSYLWIYLIVWLISGLGSIRRTLKSQIDKDPNPFLIIWGIMVTLGLLVWGAYELWGVDCADEINSNLIYTMTEINVITGFVLLGIMLIILALKGFS